MRLSSLRTLSAFLLLLTLSACAARVAPPAGGPGAPAAPAAIERFLQLAADKDYVQMGWIFGNAQGPVIGQYPLGEVEQRMYALAHVLQHDGYVLGPESAVPGRIGSAVSYQVSLTRGSRTFPVPITVARGPDSRWYVEVIDVESVTNVR